MEAVISVQGLKKRYGELMAVEDLTLEVYRGEIFGLLGHNGAGKTTSIECILGTKTCNEGKVIVLGMDPIKQRKILFERVGVQFQDMSYQDKIKVWEECEKTSSLYKNPKDYKELLKEFGLSGMEKKTITELSGGERQKLSVLQALIPNPELVFLDELTTGLDSKARRDVWKHLTRLKNKGLTVLLTSHYMDEVEALCDKVCILKKGRIIAMDTVKNLIAGSPYENLEEAYLWYSGEENEDEGIFDID